MNVTSKNECHRPMFGLGWGSHGLLLMEPRYLILEPSCKSEQNQKEIKPRRRMLGLNALSCDLNTKEAALYSPLEWASEVGPRGRGGGGVIHFSPPRKVLTRPHPSGQMIIKAPLLGLPTRGTYLYHSECSAITLHQPLFILRVGPAHPARVLFLIGVHRQSQHPLPVEHPGWLRGTFSSLPPLPAPPTALGDF